MHRKILGTFVTRFLLALLSLVIVIITSRQLGAQGVGVISLIILAITIVLTVSNFIGGGALIYLVPRHDIYKIFILGYAWAFISTIITTAILFFLKLFPLEYTRHIFSLSLINALFSTNISMLLGKEKIKQYNIATLLQTVIMLSTLVIMIFWLGRREVFSYIIALYISYISCFVISLYYILPYIKISSVKNTGRVIKEIFKYGSYVQMSSIIQLFNYRLNYYLINYFYNKALLGVFTIGVQLSEGLWLISKSIATVQYARIANTNDAEYAKTLTIKFLKMTFVATLITIIPLLILPHSFFILVFGAEFGMVKDVMILLSVGILAVAVNSIFSHFYSGTGRHYLNTIGSGIGLVMTLIAGLILIPRYGLNGAAITASLSYLTSLVFQMIVFGNITKTKMRDYIPTADDFRFFINEMKKAANAKSLA